MENVHGFVLTFHIKRFNFEGLNVIKNNESTINKCDQNSSLNEMVDEFVTFLIGRLMKQFG
jgi:hypothetical protein